MLAILAAFLSHASAGEVTVSLRGPASYVQPGAAALVIETLAHVDRQKYCRLIADLANEPLSNGSDVVADLLKRSGVTDVQADAIWLSLGFNEFGPAAAQNFTTSRARCGPSNGRKVATDFLSPFDYEPGMQVQYLAPEPTGDILMTGFGGSLDLKRTDYLVIDDDGSAGKIRDDSNMLERLTAKEIGNIGLRAVSHIINADDPMAAFVDVSQNFPPRARHLLKSKVSRELKEACSQTKQTIPGNAFVLNGVQFEPELDRLLPFMRDELALMSALREQGLSYEQAISLLALDAEAATDRLDRFDVRSEAVHYLNDFEADEMYESWPRDLSVFQRPLYPGQFHTLGRNFHTLIFPADLTTAADVERISQYLTLIRRGIPLRFGFVPLVETAEQRQAMAAFAEVHKVRSVEQAVELLRAAAIDNDLARPFGKLMKQAPEGPMALTSLDDLQDPDECTAASDWVLRFGGNAFINGIRVDLSGDSLQKIAQYMRDDTGMTQELVMSDDVQRLLLMNDLQDIFLAGANLRYSSALYGDRKYLKMAEVAELQHRCDKDFDIVSSGLTWPIEQTALPRGCITALDGRGEPRIVINGRVVEQLPIEDLDTLLEQEDAEASRVRKLAQSVGAVFSSRLLTILRSGRGLMRVEIPEVQGLNSFTTGQKDAPLQFRIFVDPLTKQAQRWSAIAQRLSGMSGVAVSITFSPQFNLKELPLKRYYRLALPGRYDIATRSELRFENLPSDLLVFELDPWDSWGIVPVVAAEDLDNLQLSSSSQVEAVFQIDHVLVQGHAREVNSERPPRGAQVELRGYDDTVVAETIVMANLGYFQLKAQLGTYTLALKPGRTTDVFKFSDLDVEVLGWSGVTIRPRLARNKGMEAADVLEGLGKSKKSLWDTVRGRQDKQPINIFTVASGHLYERFVYIMCTSVMEHTKQNVKFWFISNFLSPQFRRFIPHLAAELGFDYEFITFSWPNWLRRQTEKQRIIWGYKILFLDVMFPLDVDKVIFVDADQVVRADLQELVDEDLDGKVWGYTPMCDSRKEMEGYRFWKKGYWKDFLQGKPYHISALYVIDLFAFRQQAIGDRLRQQYHQLSADPASLSNLDQDLPNNMQHQVPIHSLPQEWLWCETWCDDKSLKKAKTIDLCQNPETKEPKLDRARRQLPEWTEFDERVKSLARKVAVKHQHLGSITSDVDEVGQNIAMVREQEAVVQVDRVDGASGHDEL